MKKILLVATLSLAFLAAGCGPPKEAKGETAGENTEGMAQENTVRVITDGAGREVEIPETVDSIVCLNVSTLRYTCYMQAQDLVAGVEDYEKERSLSRPYNYVNFETLEKLPVIGSNGEYYTEEIIGVEPDVIMMSAFGDNDPEALQEVTGIPVVSVPGSDGMLDEGAYETIRIMGEVYGKEDRAEELIQYMDQVQEDLQQRVKEVKEEEKPSVYVGGVSYKGVHGLEGTEAGYGPLVAVEAKNLADETGQKGPFNVDLEQILDWNPEVMFVDFNGLDLIEEHHKENPDFYDQLQAVQEGKVYSQISFRSSASNLETALADAYYGGTVLYPEQFQDIDPEEKADEIFNQFLGRDFYQVLKENGYGFRQIHIGEE